MKASNIFSLVLILAVLTGMVYIFSDNGSTGTKKSVVENNGSEKKDEVLQTLEIPTVSTEGPVTITPISHATMVLEWNETTIYVDPVGGSEQFTNSASPDIILVTDVHGDHLDTATLETITTADTTIIAPMAVYNELSKVLQSQTTILANEETTGIGAFTITGVAMYNLPENKPDSKHVKGRGNGYVIDDESFRVYIAGDTEATEEFRAMENIDIAFVPMNLPYTMDEIQAAVGVAQMNPAVVFPYHFRTPEGFSDVYEFKEKLAMLNTTVQVKILDWYKDTNEDTTR